jgi:hypothetical protein
VRVSARHAPSHVLVLLVSIGTVLHTLASAFCLSTRTTVLYNYARTFGRMALLMATVLRLVHHSEQSKLTTTSIYSRENRLLHR